MYKMHNTEEYGTGRKERLEARVTAQQKALFQQAADIEGRTLTDFMLDNLQKAARQVIKEYNIIELSASDSKIFVETLLNPPAPGRALIKAARRYKDRQK